MGAIFGRMNIEEPAFQVLAKHTNGFSYEVRQYGTRFAAETINENDKGFMTLARYIGVFGKPENTSPQESIAMTAPVGKTAQAIAMTAPVVKQTRHDDDENSDPTKESSSSSSVMQFMLPAKFQSLDQIPQPTNAAVRIREIPPTAGAVHQYSGSYSNELARTNVIQLAQQLRQDGVSDATDEWALSSFVWYGYNPPMTLPPFRRVEVFVPLTEQQVAQLVSSATSTNETSAVN